MATDGKALAIHGNEVIFWRNRKGCAEEVLPEGLRLFSPTAPIPHFSATNKSFDSPSQIDVSTSTIRHRIPLSEVHQAIFTIMSFYDEVEIEDMTYHEDTSLYTFPCPCGDQFEISLGDLRDGEEVAVCPSCSLQIKVIFDEVWYMWYTGSLLGLTACVAG